MANDETHRSKATLPDGREVILTWECGDCIDARLVNPKYTAADGPGNGSGEFGEVMDLMSVIGSREECEAWLDENFAALNFKR